MDRLEDELRRKHPGPAKAAASGRSRRSAIWLHCKACVGGSTAEAARCDAGWCALWPYRPTSTRVELGAAAVRPGGEADAG